MLAVAATGLFLSPLRAPYQFAGADTLHHSYRLVEFDRVLRDGVLLPRWAPDLYYGYGYPLFNYYAPLIYYVGEAFHLLGAGFQVATKLQVALGVALSAATAYLLGRRFLHSWPAALAAVLYVYAPYHLFDVYLAGELAQAFAWAWPPLALWGLLGLAAGEGLGTLLVTALAVAGLLLTHTLSAFLGAGFLGTATLWLAAVGPHACPPSLRPHASCSLPLRARVRVGAVARLRFLILAAAAAGLGGLMAASFWVPALWERGAVQVERAHESAYYDFHHNFPTPGTLFSRDWRFDWASPPQDPNGYARAGLFQTGLAALGAVAVMGRVGAGAWRRRPRPNPLLPGDGPGHKLTEAFHCPVFLAITALALVGLMLPGSAQLWEALPLGRFVQFPTRLLALYSLCCAGLGGAALESLWVWSRPREAFRVGAVVAVGVAAVWSAWGGFRVQFVALPNPLTLADVSRFELLSGHLGTSTWGEFLPTAVTVPAASSPMMAFGLLAGQPRLGKAATLDPPEAGTARVTEATSDRASVVARVVRPAILTLATPAFPGWVARLDGQPAALTVEPGSGLLQLALPPGDHRLDFTLTLTPIRALAQALSVLGWVTSTAITLVALRSHRPSFRVPRPRLSHLPSPISPSRLLIVQLPLLISLFWPWGLPAVEGQRPLDLAFQGGPRLTGYDLLPAEAGTVAARFHLEPPGAAFPAELSLTNAAGQTWASGRGELRDGAVWRLGLPPGTPPNVYEFRLRLGPPGQERPVATHRLTYFLPFVNEARLGPVDVAPGQARGSVPDGAAPVQAEFGGRLALAGADPWPAEVQQGGPLPVGLYWKALATRLPAYAISLRLVDAAGDVWGQHDAQPAGGQYPPSWWAPGALVHDVKTVYVDPSTPPGQYTLLARVYQPRPAGGGPLLPRPAAAEDGRSAPLGAVHVTPALPGRAPPPGVPSNARFGDGLRLLGFDLLTPEVSPGGAAALTLYWQATLDGGPYQLHLQAAAAGGLTTPLASATHPLQQLLAGEVVASRLKLPIQVDARPGPASLSLSVLNADGPMAVSGAPAEGSRAILGRSVVVRDLARRFEAPLVQHPLRVRFGDVAELLGYDLRLDAEQQVVELTLAWRALAPTRSAYKVFTHLLAPDGSLAGQHDGEPIDGARPTTGWQPGEVLEDRHRLPLPRGAARMHFTLEVGLYAAEGGARLLATDADGRPEGDHVILASATP